MLAHDDARLLHEGHHDKTATADVTKLTAEPAFQAALVVTRTGVESAFNGLVGATQGVAKESEETRRERLKLEAVAAKAQGQWRFVSSEASRVLLNPPPEVVVTAEEITEREDLLARLFPVAPYDFGRQTVAWRIELLRSSAQLARAAVVRQVLGEPLADLITGRFDAAQAAITAQQDELTRELREDREAHAALAAAREVFVRALQVHTLMVRLVLVHGGREAELGRYVRAQDAAYRARRLSGRSMKEEEGIEAVTTALGVTPDSIDIAPPPG